MKIIEDRLRNGRLVLADREDEAAAALGALPARDPRDPHGDPAAGALRHLRGLALETPRELLRGGS